ncbi:Colorectal mutant cancer protein [Bagarius yarrelli]|uniref:Colorectal mutant cancer protein n=1 Tax=Bagarius yarrelli TaxID=175774 RepID=A0A556UET4_BAGYA|nr:Colorectal mutant cancer protein [Bagarius yarrelli]
MAWCRTALWICLLAAVYERCSSSLTSFSNSLSLTRTVRSHVQQLLIRYKNAEMKAHLYLLEKEKKTLELKLSTQETCEQAYLVQIEHLKSEVEEQQEQRRSQNFTGSSSKDKCAKGSSVNKVSELTGISDSDPAAELTNVLQKELKLKVRVKDLLAALEKLTKCSEIRNQQSSEFVW